MTTEPTRPYRIGDAVIAFGAFGFVAKTRPGAVLVGSGRRVLLWHNVEDVVPVLARVPGPPK